MKYNKPTIQVLDEAVRVIQGKGSLTGDSPFNQNDIPVPPAYELDE